MKPNISLRQPHGSDLTANYADRNPNFKSSLVKVRFEGRVLNELLMLIFVMPTGLLLPRPGEG